MVIVFSAAAFFGLSLAGISPWWSFLGIGGLVLFLLLRVNYNRHMDLKQKVTECQQEILLLKEQLAPKLEILFGVGESFEEERTVQRDLKWRVCRIKVINTSRGKMIENVRVQMETTKGFHVSFLPIGLREMFGRPSPFRLNPGESMFFNVAEKIENPIAKTDEICLAYEAKNRWNWNRITKGRYTIGVLATGDNVPPCQKSFVIEVNEQDRLLLSEAS